MNKVLLTFFLMIICILVMMFISPIIDHFFYIDEKIEKMSKLKTKSSAKKRFKITGSGKIKRKHAFKNHILTKKSKKRKLKLTHDGLVNDSDLNNIKKQLRLK